MRVHYPFFFYDFAWDMFSIVRCWSPGTKGPDRGRMFEQLFYRYCESKGLPLSERAGARTLNFGYSASGFLHESDAVIATPEINLHVELKHLTQAVSKTELLSFNQKGLDFLAAENPSVRRKPLFRAFVTATPVGVSARMFALQWGILLIEPDRLPLLAMHSCAGRLRTESGSERIVSEVPLIIVPLQDRLKQLASAISRGGPVLSETRTAWMLDAQQRDGNRYWRAMDRTDPNWIEERYDAIFSSTGKRQQTWRLVSTN